MKKFGIEYLIKMEKCRLGYYFGRIKGSDKITVVSCWGDKIEKEEKEDVIPLEKVPLNVLKCASNGIKIMNLSKIINGLNKKTR